MFPIGRSALLFTVFTATDWIFHSCAHCFGQFHDRTEDLNGTSSVSVTLRSVVTASTVLLLVQIFRCHRIEIRLEKVKCRLYKARRTFSERSRALDAPLHVTAKARGSLTVA